jgi:hypothetical protein
MLGMGKRYRVVQRDADGVRAWSPQTRAQALVGFSQRIAAGGFSPWSGPQLMVLSEEEWERLGRPSDGDGITMPPIRRSEAGEAPVAAGSRRMFRWLSSSRSRS